MSSFGYAHPLFSLSLTPAVDRTFLLHNSKKHQKAKKDMLYISDVSVLTLAMLWIFSIRWKLDCGLFSCNFVFCPVCFCFYTCPSPIVLYKQHVAHLPGGTIEHIVPHNDGQGFHGDIAVHCQECSALERSPDEITRHKHTHG